jgi:hypothetical protein
MPANKTNNMSTTTNDLDAEYILLLREDVDHWKTIAAEASHQLTEAAALIETGMKVRDGAAKGGHAKAILNDDDTQTLVNHVEDEVLKNRASVLKASRTIRLKLSRRELTGLEHVVLDDDVLQPATIAGFVYDARKRKAV